MIEIIQTEERNRIAQIFTFSDPNATGTLLEQIRKKRVGARDITFKPGALDVLERFRAKMREMGSYYADTIHVTGDQERLVEMEFTKLV